MAQHPLVIENVNGADLMAELGPLFEAIASLNSGPTEPPRTLPFMWWADTTTGLLKIRNADNSAWITRGMLDTPNLGRASLGPNTFTGTQNLAGNTLQRATLQNYSETVNPLGSIAGAVTVSTAFGNVASGEVVGDVAFSFTTTWPAGVASSLTLWLTNGGAHEITWPAGVKWPLAVRLAGGDGPLLGDNDWLTFLTLDGGATWYGFPTVLRQAPGFAKVLSVTETSIATLSVNNNIDMPATVNAGELLACIVQHTQSGSTVTPPAGWTTKRQHPFSGVYVRKADGTEGGTTFNWQTEGSSSAAAQVYRITDWYGDLAGVEINSEVSGFSDTPNPGNAVPSWGSARTLFIAHTTGSNDDATVATAPTGYSGLLSTTSGAGTNAGGHVGSATRELEAASDNPDAFRLSASQNWGAAVLMVRPAS